MRNSPCPSHQSGSFLSFFFLLVSFCTRPPLVYLLFTDTGHNSATRPGFIATTDQFLQVQPPILFLKFAPSVASFPSTSLARASSANAKARLPHHRSPTRACLESRKVARTRQIGRRTVPTRSPVIHIRLPSPLTFLKRLLSLTAYRRRRIPCFVKGQFSPDVLYSGTLFTIHVSKRMSTPRGANKSQTRQHICSPSIHYFPQAVFYFALTDRDFVLIGRAPRSPGMSCWLLLNNSFRKWLLRPHPLQPALQPAQQPQANQPLLL